MGACSPAAATPAAESEVRAQIGALFRRRAGQMVACLTRIFGLQRLDLVEDAVQDALLSALRQWPYHGLPRNPGAWIIQAAKHRALDILRRERTWLGKDAELRRLIEAVPDEPPEVDAAFARDLRDDELRLVIACCHPAIAPESQVALTLKIVGGFGVRELARAFLVSEKTIQQRLVRAKRLIRGAGVSLVLPAGAELGARLGPALHAVYLMFNEGYSALEGEQLVRFDLCREALRLAELLCEHPDTGRPETDALMALLLLQGSRLPARADAEGELRLLAEQDRTCWDRSMIARGLHYLRRSARGEELSRYHLEAEIAACHAVAVDEAGTDWRRILGCYDELARRVASPVIALNRVVALAYVEGPRRALEQLEAVRGDPALAGYAPALITQAQILARLDRRSEAADCFERARALVRNEPVRRFLARQIDALRASRREPRHRAGLTGAGCASLASGLAAQSAGPRLPGSARH